MTALRWIFVVIALVAAALAFVHYAGQRVLYPAPPAPTDDAVLGPHDRPIWLERDGTRSEAIWLPSNMPGNRPAPLVIYAHGNGELIDYWVDRFAPLRDAGVSVLLVEYPGYGRSPGSPSQASITRAMTAAYDWAASEPGVDRTQISGWGRPLARLVLESTFTSVRAMAKELFGVPGWLVRDPFDNLAAVRAFAGPILQLHGERDSSIPLAHAQALHLAAAHSKLHVLPCGHNDCAYPWDLVVPFLLAR